MDLREKIVFVVSDVDKALAFEWTVPRIGDFYEVYVILIGEENTSLGKYLDAVGIRVIEINNNEFSGNLTKWLRLCRVIGRIKPDIVHTHLWRANILGLTSSWLLRVKRRIFTRHHAMVHYHEHPSGRKWDKLCNFLATDIIAISENIKDILIERDGASPHKIHLLHHGFDLSYFENVDSDCVSELRIKHRIGNSAKPVIGVIARYIDWKGIQYIIPAFRSILSKYADAHLVLANANGPYRQSIQDLLNTLPDGSYTEISFEPDLSALYRLFDIYVHVPVDEHAEAFGQTYVEALLCKIPSVFTNSGIAREFIVNGKHARIVPFRDSRAIEKAIMELLGNENLQKQFREEGFRAAGAFGLENHLNNLLTIYRR